MQGDLQEITVRLSDNISRVLVGKKDIIELVLVAMGCEGHILLEDVPGVGKTMLARALAASIGLTFHRIQCTPDLLPSDITGMTVYNPKTAEFSLHTGAIMANILLVDEINRATPRTQSSLLEAMAESQVTIDGQTYSLNRPFLVVATENPLEFEGTFPLPEAQLDRFLLRIGMGYPTKTEQLEILARMESTHPIEHIGPVVTAEEINGFICAGQKVYFEDSLREYLVTIVTNTRNHPDVVIGASPRGAIGLFQASRILALLRGRDYVIPDDIKYLAPYVLAHRIIVSPESSVRGINSTMVVQDILRNTSVPTEVPLK